MTDELNFFIVRGQLTARTIDAAAMALTSGVNSLFHEHGELAECFPEMQPVARRALRKAATSPRHFERVLGVATTVAGDERYAVLDDLFGLITERRMRRVLARWKAFASMRLCSEMSEEVMQEVFESAVRLRSEVEGLLAVSAEVRLVLLERCSEETRNGLRDLLLVAGVSKTRVKLFFEALCRRDGARMVVHHARGAQGTPRTAKRGR